MFLKRLDSAGKRNFLFLVAITVLAASACTNKSEMTIAYLVPAYGKMKFVNQNGILINEVELGQAPSFCSWSPEKDSIAFADIWDDSLYTINPDGTGLTKIIQVTGGMRKLSWSPDGEKIAFDTNTPYNNTPQSGRESEVHLINVAYSESVPLIAGMSPDWSPTGESIVFVAMTAPGGFPHIFVVGIDGNNSTQLTEGFTANYSPRWSPNSDRIAFISTRDYPNGGGREIYVMNTDGSDVMQLTNLTSKDLKPIDLEWSPTGNQMAILATGVTTDVGLYIIDTDDLDMQLVAYETSMACPVWITLP